MKQIMKTIRTQIHLAKKSPRITVSYIDKLNDVNLEKGGCKKESIDLLREKNKLKDVNKNG